MLTNVLGLLREKNDLYAYGRPPKARTWPHYLKNDIEYVFLFGLDLDYN